MHELQPSDAGINGLYRGFDRQIDRNPSIRLSTVIARSEAASTLTRLAMRDEAGVGFWDVLRLHDDLLVCAADSYYHGPFSFDVHPSADLVSMRFVVSGTLHVRSRKSREVIARPGTASLVRVSSLRSHAVAIEARRRLMSLTLHFRADRLAAIMGMEPDELPQLLRAFLEPGEAMQFCATPLTPAMRNAVLDSIDAPFDGALRRRYLEAKVMELLCLFLESAARNTGLPERAGPLGPPDRARLYHVRDLLLKDLRDPPSINELARAVGINRTKLQRAFKDAFGATIFDFCHQRRMALARELLQDRGMSIGEVADAVGYSHATNFTAAFRRHFKQLPKQFRRP